MSDIFDATRFLNTQNDSGVNKFKIPKDSFGNYVEPVFHDNLDTSEVTNVSELVFDYMKAKAPILNIHTVEEGEFVAGLVYCDKTIAATNKFDINKYDITFDFIDGNGVLFKGKAWSENAKNDFKDKVLYVEGTLISYSDTITRFRVDAYRVYDTQIPKSLFIKEIPNIENIKSEVEHLIRNCLSDTNPFKSLLFSIYFDDQYLNNLKESTYKQTIGTQLGAKLKFIVEAVRIFESMSLSNFTVNTSYVTPDFYLPLVLLHVVDLDIKQRSATNTSNEINKSSENSYVSMYMMKKLVDMSSINYTLAQSMIDSLIYVNTNKLSNSDNLKNEADLYLRIIWLLERSFKLEFESL